jgi:hypothetical protein
MGKGLIGAALAAVAPLAALLAVAGCGGSGHPAGTFVPQGSATAAPSSAGPATPGLVHFAFPASVHIDFQAPVPAGQPERSVVRTDENFQLAYYWSLYSEGGDQHFARYIASPTVLSAVQASVAQNFAQHERIRGTLRIYRTTVTPVAASSGTQGGLAVSFCGDNSRLTSVSARTGAVIPDQTPAAHHWFSQTDSYTTRHGAWALASISTTFYPTGPARECKP